MNGNPQEKQERKWHYHLTHQPFLIEIAIFLLGALAIDAFIFQGDRFASLTPHPFWIIVLLVTVQYGTVPGLAAAILSSLAFLLYNIPPQTLDENLFGYLFRISKTPNMWLVAAVVLGEIRTKHKRQSENLEKDKHDMETQQNVLAESFRQLSGQKDNLEKALAGQLKTVTTMYQAFKAIENMDPNQVLDGIEKITTTIMNCKQFSLYLIEDNQLKGTMFKGWKADHDLEKNFHPRTALFKTIVAERRIVSVSKREDQVILDDQGVLAGPLVLAEDDEVFGMIKIEDMGFVDLNVTSVENFKILCEWISSAYMKAKEVEKLKAGRFINPDFNLLSKGYFNYQVQILSALGMRFKFDISMILINVKDMEKLTLEDYEKVPPAISAAANEVLRTTDLAFDSNETEQGFAIVLPGANLENTSIVANKLNKAITKQFNNANCPAELDFQMKALFSHPDLNGETNVAA